MAATRRTVDGSMDIHDGRLSDDSRDSGESDDDEYSIKRKKRKIDIIAKGIRDQKFMHENNFSLRASVE